VEDFTELLAEVGLIMALSACPAGDDTPFQWGTMEATCRPLDVEMLTVSGTSVSLMEGWTSPPVSSYDGIHGLKFPTLAT
jgi:uncharacterized protein